MMSVTARIINRPTTVILFFLILVGFAIYMLPHIAVNLFPETEMPMIVVLTSYSGTGPEEIEQNITKVLESQLSNVNNLVSMTSTSSEGSSLIMLEFKYSTDLDKATNDIRDKLEIASNMLPDDADKPAIFRLDPNSFPIMNLVVRGNRTTEELYNIASDIIQSKLERIEGVSATSIRGGREKIIRVEITQNRLEAFDLTLTSIAQSLSTQNIQLGAGEIEDSNKVYNIRTNEEFGSIDEIKNIVIATKTVKTNNVIEGKNPLITVKLSDVADVFEGYSDSESIVYINGEPGIYISVQKESDANSADVANNVRNQLKSINSTLPEGIELSIIWDSTKMIRNTINQIYQSLVIGIVLAMIILSLILRNVKSTLIIGLAIPISIMITIMFMYFFNLTLNVMTLTGLILALGMVVDSSIVILENIFRYRERGAQLHSAAILGSREMITAISASSLTTVCVFIPIIIFKNELKMLGQLFTQLGFTIIIAILSSLLIAVTLVPVLASKYMKLYSRKQKPLKLKILRMPDTFLENIFQALERGYKKALGFALRNKKLIVLLVLVILILTVQRFLSMGINMFPPMSEDSVTISVELPVGATLSRTTDVIQKFEQIIEKEINGYEDIIVTCGSGEGFFGGSSSYKGQIEIVLPEASKQIDTMTTVQQKLRNYFHDFPGVTFSFSAGFHRIGNINPVDILVKSDDLENAKKVAERIRDLMKNNLNYVTEPAIDLSEGLPQYELVINRERAYSLGLNIKTIAHEISACVNGTVATKYHSNGEEMDVLVILDKKDRQGIPDLDKIFVTGSTGKRIKISNIACFKESTGPISIKREDEVRTVHVTGGLIPGFGASVAEKQIRALVSENIVLDETFSIEYGGDFADIQTYGTQFIVILIMAVILVFGVMASLFESLLDPFIIFLTIPLMFIGVIWLYTILGTTFSMMSAVGLVVLAGIVVNNEIVLVDYTNLLRERGRSIFDACLEAGGNRLRPIIMTSFTTILGMVPMSFFPGEGSELVQPIGQTIVGGMLISTFMTLFLTPVLYSIFNRKHKNNRKKGREATLLKKLEGQV
jgi:HAE1 family hydrophobic/amphiphilic exporter-1